MEVSTLCVPGGTYDKLSHEYHPNLPMIGAYELELRREPGETRQQSLKRHQMDLANDLSRTQRRLGMIAQALALEETLSTATKE
jgi:hypothetical protein